MKSTENLYVQYVQGTERKAIVQTVTALLCHFTIAVLKGIDSNCTKVYINTRVIKHVYDKQPAQEFDFLVANIYKVAKFPDRIYKNKDGKRGSYCFIKKIKNETCFVSVQTIQENELMNHCEVVTFFRINDENYLRSYELLWKWEGGNPPS